MSFKVVMVDTIFPDFSIEQEVLNEIDANFVFVGDKDEDAIINLAKDADALVTVYAEITRNIIEKLEKCRIIVRCGIGVNNIDIQAATEKGIYVANVPDYCWDEVSDHAMALVLTLERKILLFDKKVKSGDWSHDGATPIYGLRGQTFGLVGFGNIPKMVAKKAQAFGFNVVAYDPFVAQEAADQYNVKMVSLEELLKVSDVISIHAPLTDDTYHMVNKDTLSLMKPTAYLVNTARGPIVDTEALYEALKDHKIAGAALDVLEVEPPTKVNPLLTLDNVILTPHAAFYSEASSINLRRLAFTEVVRVLKGGYPKNFVNKKQLSR
ncbi:MAG: C-terminal binding protein [Thermoanaerobacteraceae bacterium]|nr:C-terminal binding protein [Thermoanaerobacteraceae bacterium]